MLFQVVTVILLIFLIGLVIILLIQQRDRYSLAESNRTLADKVGALSRIFERPSARGRIGEITLESLLMEVFGNAYQMQFALEDGSRVDAAIMLPDGRAVFIDSKFPLDNFEAMATSKTKEELDRASRAFGGDCYRHIQKIATTYVRPADSGFDFALMYIPAEGVYHQFLASSYANESLINCALKNRVIPVSPLSLYAYLSTILYGLRGLRVEAKADEILRRMLQLQIRLGHLERELQTMDDHLDKLRKKREGDVALRLGELKDELERMFALTEMD